MHYETTGLPHRVLKDGQEITIDFTDDSESEALRALYALNVTLFLPNTDGDQLVVRGVLDDVVLHTPNDPNKATSEPYRRFRLTSWQLLAPFKRWDHEPKIEEEPMPVMLDTQLRASDFDEPVSGDLSRFVRQ